MDPSSSSHGGEESCAKSGIVSSFFLSDGRRRSSRLAYKSKDAFDGDRAVKKMRKAVEVSDASMVNGDKRGNGPSVQAVRVCESQFESAIVENSERDGMKKLSQFGDVIVERIGNEEDVNDLWNGSAQGSPTIKSINEVEVGDKSSDIKQESPHVTDEKKGEGMKWNEPLQAILMRREGKEMNKTNEILSEASIRRGKGGEGNSSNGIAHEAAETRKNRRKDKFLQIARSRASKFAHFSSEDVEFENGGDDIREETPLNVQEEEEWPGPVSTAMRILRDRAQNLTAQKVDSAQIPNKQSYSIQWTPAETQIRPIPKWKIPSLQDLSIAVLCDNACAISSFEGVPDILRHKIVRVLCDSRRMNISLLKLLFRGSPTEIRLNNCSWVKEEQLQTLLTGINMDKLRVLQLDLCGGCLPDYILYAALDHLPCLASLSIVSLKGACRLSDVGLSVLVSSSPSLRSLNLGFCSLVTSDGINFVTEKLRSVLRELYVDNCDDIDAMKILPSLKKLESLQVFSMCGVQSVSDVFVSELMQAHGSDMKELMFAGCRKLSDKSIKTISENCPDLHALNIAGICKLTDSCMRFLSNGCRSITMLKICRNNFSDEAIASFLELSGHSLRELSLNNINKVSNNTATSLVNHCSEKLLCLDLSFCRHVSNEALGFILDNCLSLKILKLFGCTQITNMTFNGHSNPNVYILGQNLKPILEHLDTTEFQWSELQFSRLW